MRYTSKQLDNDLARINSALAASGSAYFFKRHDHSGHACVVLCYVETDGQIHGSQRYVETGTPRQCLETTEREARNMKGSISFRDTAHTRAQARRRLELEGIDFAADPHKYTMQHGEALETWAKLTKYRKPRAASHSLGYAFFVNLSKVEIPA